MKSATNAIEALEILIAEDSPTQSAQLVHLLEQRGYSVKEARNGREALQLLERATPALVITDVVMPEMDGYALCRAIKNEPRLKHLPVILVTTLADAADVIRGLECGADNFIRKPYEERYLLSRIDYLLMNQRMRRNQKMQMGIEISLGNHRHFITSERQQILDLLISTYEQAVHINTELALRENELAHANEVLGALYRIAEGLNQAYTEKEVAELALERAMELPNVHAGWIFLRDDSRDPFRLVASRNISPALLERGWPKGDCKCQQLCAAGTLNSVTNILECERLQRTAPETGGLLYHATVPLWHGEKTLGIMNLAGPLPGTFAEHELRILHNVGHQVAVALDRTRLRERLERLVEERTATLEAEVAERVRTEQRLKETLQSVREGEQQLHESEERYRLLFDRNPHPTWVYDLSTLFFLAVNSAAIAHYGYSRDEFLRMTILDIRPLDDAAKSSRTLDETAESPTQPVDGSLRHKTKGGDLIEVEIASSEITFSGRRAGLVQAIDVTEKRRLEQQFLRAQRMESIGTLAGGIAHDLNNLLMPITIGVSLLKRTETSERNLRALDNIERSAKRGKDLVRQVLSFARGVEGSRVPVHIGDVVNEVESIAESTFPKNVSMKIDVPGDLWWIDGDPTQLNQVLLNLCVNARDAMPKGGRLSVVARNVDIDEHYAQMNRGMAAGRYVMIEVVDEGVGMPSEVKERIFEPFFTTKDVGRGTGLGLSTVAAIVRSHAGVINVYSEVDKGTSFRVYLPAQRHALHAAESETKPEVLPRGNGETILVVDDEASILAITEQTLEAYGYKVLTADDGAQAVGLFAMHRSEIDAVITDMMMPVLDGPALIAALRRIEPDVRIIASSGLDETSSKAVQIAYAGVKHFLHKPYSAEILLSTLHEVLQ